MLAQQPVGLQFAALRGIGVDRGLIPAVDEGQIRQMIAVARANGDALRRYRPRSYGGDVTLFVAGDGLRASYRLGEDLGWSRHAVKRLEIIPVPGTHYSMMVPPDVNELGKKLMAALTMTTRREPSRPGSAPFVVDALGRAGEQRAVSPC